MSISRVSSAVTEMSVAPVGSRYRRYPRSQNTPSGSLPQSAATNPVVEDVPRVSIRSTSKLKSTISKDSIPAQVTAISPQELTVSRQPRQSGENQTRRRAKREAAVVAQVKNIQENITTNNQ